VRYLLDTTFVIDHLRDDQAAVDRFARLFEEGDEGFVTDVVAAEAWTGAPSDDDTALSAMLEAVEYVTASPDDARIAGRLRARARADGRHLGLPDALIAATAMTLGAAILTRNVRDFSLTPVRVETY
jgi:predicted nucleic acid-binding protein